MNYLIQALREHQELAIFLTLAIGFFIGRLKIGTFSLGTAVGTLLAGVAIGQLNIQVPAVVKYVFFDLFLFTTGYKVGPQFFRALKKDAMPQLALTLVLCVTCLLAAYGAAKLLGYDMGTAAGMLAGAFTESTVIGTASDAINRVATISDADKTSLINNIPVAYAVTYLIGTAFIVWFLPNVGPKLMRVDLKEEARKLRAQDRSRRRRRAGDSLSLPSAGGSRIPGHQPGLNQSERGRAGGAAQTTSRLYLPNPPGRQGHRARPRHGRSRG